MAYPNDAAIMPLLRDLDNVPAEYLRQVSHIKRVLERWTADPVFELAFKNDPENAIASLGVDITPKEILPLINVEAAAKLREAIANNDSDNIPVSTLRYQAFIVEKLAHRKSTREDSRSTHTTIAAWRDRQIIRCASELGNMKSEAIVHPPVSFEISKGCTVGCWFCGIDAPKFDHNWKYTPQNAKLWLEVLEVVKNVLGTSVRTGFLYWATDPMDNPDYEKFLRDFYAVTGKCPQTTTALGVKDVERTRKLLDFTRTMDGQVDRFSVLSLAMLQKVHDSFTPEELIKVECIPQNREAKGRSLKSNAGRAKRYSLKKADELNQGGMGDTIACVSGFLFNMPDQEVKLVTPCQTNERWPLGYWVIAKARFKSAAELKIILDEMVQKHMKTRLRLGDKIRLRRDLNWETTGSSFKLNTKDLSTSFPLHKSPDSLMHLIENGDHTLEYIAQERYEHNNVPMEETFFLLNELFIKGFIDEEPECEVPETIQKIFA